MAASADISGSRPLPRNRASRVVKRLPSTRWAMVTPADVLGSRLLPRNRASHIAKLLHSRRWAMMAPADVLNSLCEVYRGASSSQYSPFRANNVIDDHDEYENKARRVLATSPGLIAPAIHRTEDPSVVGPTV